jgi:hypothetical protein
MGLECSTSFADLFHLARGRPWTAQEEDYFRSIDQDTRNRLVKELASAAGCVRTDDRRGSDGLIYTAFWIEQPPSEPRDLK